MFSFFRIVHLKIIYPSLIIDFNCHVSSGCKISCSDNSHMTLIETFLGYGVILKADYGGVLSIIKSYVGSYSHIVSTEKIWIKDNCEIAEMVVIRDQDHISKKDSEKRISEQGFISAPIIINKNVWIGAKATILKGVTIGRNSVIAAGAVVNKNIAAYERWGGVPAKNIKPDND